MEETQNYSVSVRSVGIKYGLVLALISIIYFIILNLLGIDVTQGVGRWASMVFNFGILIAAHRYYKENKNGYMSYGEGFGIGFWIAMIAPSLSGLFTYVYIKFIDTGFIQQMHDQARESLEDRGMLTEDQIDQAMYVSEKFLTAEYLLILGLIGGGVLLIIVSALTTLFTWKPYKNEKNQDLID